MPADFKPFDKAEWLRLEKKADELSKHRFDDIYVIIKSKSVYTVLLLP